MTATLEEEDRDKNAAVISVAVQQLVLYIALFATSAESNTKRGRKREKKAQTDIITVKP